jgi:hypothetical protein
MRFPVLVTMSVRGLRHSTRYGVGLGLIELKVGGFLNEKLAFDLTLCSKQASLQPQLRFEAEKCAVSG